MRYGEVSCDSSYCTVYNTVHTVYNTVHVVTDRCRWVSALTLGHTWSVLTGTRQILTLKYWILKLPRVSVECT